MLLILCSSNLWTALYMAAHHGFEHVCKLLIDFKSDINATTLCDLWTPLRSAAYNGRTKACQVLIAAKADVNARTRCAFMSEI